MNRSNNDTERVSGTTYPTGYTSSESCAFTQAMVASATDSETMQRSLQQLLELHALTEAVTRAARLEEIYHVAMTGMQRALKADRVAVLLFENDGAMRFKAWLGLSAEYRAAVENHSPWAQDTVNPAPILVPNILDSHELAAFLPAISKEGISSLNFIPLLQDGRLLGKLMLYYDAPREFTELECNLALSCARQIASAIERQRSQDALRQSQERLSRALDAGSMGTWDYDIASGKVLWSPQVEAIHGLEPGSFDGTFEAYTRDIHPEDYAAVMQGIGTSLHEGRPHDVEYRLVRPDKSVVWVHGKGDVVRDDEGAIIGLAGICMDVTERKHHDLLLLGQKEVKELILRGAPLSEIFQRLVCLAESQHEVATQVAIWILVEDGETMELASGPRLSEPLKEAMLQVGAPYSLEDLDLQHPEIVPDLYQDPCWHKLRAQAKSSGLQASWSMPFLDSEGKLLGLLAFYLQENRSPTARDFRLMEILSQTAAIALERVRSQETLLRAKEAADAASQAKSQFLANVSHEIRTPMTGITGAVDLLQKTDITPQQAEFLGMIKSCSEVLVTVINDVLDISKIEAGELRLDPRPFHPVSVVRDCVSLMQEPASAKGLTLSLSLTGARESRVLGDTIRLRQIILNLLNNAVKFTELGQITVRLDCRCEEERCSFRCEIEDTGIGISPSSQSVLFQPFSQVDVKASRRFGGSGLGLSISKQLVEMMGGTIGVRSEQGKGSCFYFTVNFPVFHESLSSAETLELPAPQRSTSPGALRLLLAEDNPINRRVLLLQLKQLGYNAQPASNGLEALQLLTEREFDLVLMDCQMPGLDGYEVTRRLRANSQVRQPVILALTAHALEGEREKCLQAGMDGYLRKPISVKELQSTLQAWSLSGRVKQQCV